MGSVTNGRNKSNITKLVLISFAINIHVFIIVYVIINFGLIKYQFLLDFNKIPYLSSASFFKSLILLFAQLIYFESKRFDSSCLQ